MAATIEMGRYDLTDEQYALIEPHLPSHTKKVGHPFGEHRPRINGICWHLHTGAPWPDMSERYGNGKTIYDRYSTWCRDGTWDKVIHALQINLDKHGLIDDEQWGRDGPVVRAPRAAAGAEKRGTNAEGEPADHALGRSVGGFSTKIHLLTDSNGLPLDARLSPGNRMRQLKQQRCSRRCRCHGSDLGLTRAPSALRLTAALMPGVSARGCATAALSRLYQLLVNFPH